jgi:hypothetical protein
MPAVLSKPSYGIPMGWKEGGNDGGDFHVWIEDSKGNVIFDPHFIEYEGMCVMHGCDPNQPVRHPWKDQTFWFNEKVPHEMEKLELYRTPKPFCCNYNCWAHMIYEKPKDAKIVVGSLGWRKTKKVEAWWEYG